MSGAEDNSKKLNASAKAFVPNAGAKEFVPGQFGGGNTNNNMRMSGGNEPTAVYQPGMPAVHGGPVMYAPSNVPVMMQLPEYGHPAMSLPPFVMDANPQDFMYYGQYMPMNPNAQMGMTGGGHGGHEGREGRSKKIKNKK